jgi:hypothetical protein
MSRLRAFPHSPLARHPGLLARKIAGRLGLYRENAPLRKIAPRAVVYPPHWTPLLRSWLQKVPLTPAPQPFNRVFGLEFDEAFLLQLCRDGPSRGEPGLAGDPKLIWDYSRAHPLFTNAAAAGRATLDDCAAFIRRWREVNNDTNGAAWSCAMDTAIRAVNWILADALFDGALAECSERLPFAADLHRHGQSIWRRLEARVINSNHYLANLLGLELIGAVFPEDPDARKWLSFAREEFPRALLTQTRADGGLNEASLRYHAFVTEMALLFRLVMGTPLPAAAEVRLRQMCQIVADFKDASGDVFPIGDDDSGRVLAMDAASSLGRAEILLQLASTVLDEPFGSAAQSVCPQSGWWIRRAGDFTLALDFGGVGLNGLGGHAHNDDFSFCLEWKNHPIIVDPGTFLYTSDPTARNRFRSTAYHNTLQVDELEQRVLTSSVFAMPGSDKALEATSAGEDAWVFERRVADRASHRRTVTMKKEQLQIGDQIEATGKHRLRWYFHLHPSVRGQVAPQGFVLTVPGLGALELTSDAAAQELKLNSSEHSAGYAKRESSHVCVAEGEYVMPISVEWRIRAMP